MSCGVGHRRGLDLMLLWLCLWLCLWLAGTAPIRPLAGEPQYAVGVALKDKGPPPKKKLSFRDIRIYLNLLLLKYVGCFQVLTFKQCLQPFIYTSSNRSLIHFLKL